MRGGLPEIDPDFEHRPDDARVYESDARRPRLAAVRSDLLVLSPVGLGPRRQALPQASAAVRLCAGHVVLLVRIAIEIVELLGAVTQVVDVLPVALSHPEREGILRNIEVRPPQLAV